MPPMNTLSGALARRATWCGATRSHWWWYTFLLDKSCHLAEEITMHCSHHSTTPKKIITMKNIFNECYTFNMRCMHPAVVPFHYAIFYMIQSGTYILSPDFVSNLKKIALNEALILWKMTFVPTDVKLHDVLALLFNPLSYGKKVLTTVFSIVFLKPKIKLKLKIVNILKCILLKAVI